MRYLRAWKTYLRAFISEKNKGLEETLANDRIDNSRRTIYPLWFKKTSAKPTKKARQEG